MHLKKIKTEYSADVSIIELLGRYSRYLYVDFLLQIPSYLISMGVSRSDSLINVLTVTWCGVTVYNAN